MQINKLSFNLNVSRHLMCYKYVNSAVYTSNKKQSPRKNFSDSSLYFMTTKKNSKLSHVFFFPHSTHLFLNELMVLSYQCPFEVQLVLQR